MNLNLVIKALRERCPSFGARVAGAAEYGRLAENTNFTLPAAFVVPTDERPEANRSQNGYRQTTREGFAVIIALSNTADERGEASSNNIDAFRLEIFKALLGWQVTEDYDGIEYEAGALLDVDRARLWYQFEFGAEAELSGDTPNPVTWKQIEHAALPPLEGVDVDLDAIDPMADPNLQSPGPDGRIEHRFNIDPPTS